jgi:hypothetical protein
MTRFRFVVMPLRQKTGPWRDTYQEAKLDALAEGLAHRDDYPGAPICLDELVEIEESAAE